MSLFSVIKYQVSTPPTLEEYLALPKSIQEEWTSGMGTETVMENVLFRLKSWYNTDHEQNRGCAIDATETLRKLIREYEE